MVPCLQPYSLTEEERSLEDIVNSMSEHAQAQGLTLAILESILNNN